MLRSDYYSLSHGMQVLLISNNNEITVKRLLGHLCSCAVKGLLQGE